MRRKVLMAAGVVLLGLAVLTGAVLGWFTIREYRPEAVEDAEVVVRPSTGTPGDTEDGVLSAGDTCTILSYNIGYGALSADADFFMDGGQEVRPDSKDVIEENLAGIVRTLEEQDADIYFLQEVDRDSKRSYRTDEMKVLQDKLDLTGMFACNFKCDYVPYPWPTIGKVTSGLVTLTNIKTTENQRIALPESFTWPLKTCNLKRCILLSRIPIGDEGKELVLLNFHLEAYDSGEGKIAQSRMLAGILEEERAKGNYVIAGGDFNQSFEGVDKYPIIDSSNWLPGVIGKDSIPDGFSLAYADNVPTCRSLAAPYSGNYEETQVYVIDGFIVSDNITVDQVENIDTGFAYTDHQPVRMQITLQ